MAEIRRLSASEAREYVGDLARVLVDCLMQEAERQAASEGKTLLVLDTVTGGQAERLYESLDWVKVGVIPNFALFPDGRWTGTTIFWKSPGSGRLVNE